jgi:hypothetical protein
VARGPGLRRTDVRSAPLSASRFCPAVRPEGKTMKLYHLLLLVWILFVTLWLLNAVRNKKK